VLKGLILNWETSEKSVQLSVLQPVLMATNVINFITFGVQKIRAGESIFIITVFHPQVG